MNIKSTFYILTISILVSCGQKNTSEENNSNSTNLTEEEKIKNDSIELEKHYSYYKKTTYENYRQYNTKIVADYEKDRDTLLIIDFLESNISKIFAYDDFPFKPSDLINHLFLIDINNDGDKDVIYQGPTGGEPNMTVIFLKQDKNYLEVFRQYQDIFEIEFIDDKLSKLALTNPGCCADPQVVDYFYSVSHNDNKPTFKLERTVGYLSGYEKPNNKFSQEKSFTITQDNAKLRNECYELDTEHPYYGESGNILTTYKKGSTGRAFAEKNENGVFWLYVLMDKKNKFDNNDFPTFKEQPIELYGWIKKNETDLK
jgi:hypothetical protein